MSSSNATEPLVYYVAQQGGELIKIYPFKNLILKNKNCCLENGGARDGDGARDSFGLGPS
jgi:hypothetical protein